jgi:hypothetical protein
MAHPEQSLSWLRIEVIRRGATRWCKRFRMARCLTYPLARRSTLLRRPAGLRDADYRGRLSVALF